MYIVVVMVVVVVMMENKSMLQGNLWWPDLHHFSSPKGMMSFLDLEN